MVRLTNAHAVDTRPPFSSIERGLGTRPIIHIHVIMHLSIVYPTYPTWGEGGAVVGDMTRKYGPRGGANVTCTKKALGVKGCVYCHVGILSW